jgi:molecular chaperone IbpA
MRLDIQPHLNKPQLLAPADCRPSLGARAEFPSIEKKIDDNNYRIILPVPGISEKNLEITKNKNNLTVMILEEEDDERFFDFNPIWQRNLKDHMEVKDAYLKDGLLQINIERNLPKELQPQKVAIHTSKKK